jgi:hypothetical protein
LESNWYPDSLTKTALATAFPPKGKTAGRSQATAFSSAAPLGKENISPAVLAHSWLTPSTSGERTSHIMETCFAIVPPAIPVKAMIRVPAETFAFSKLKPLMDGCAGSDCIAAAGRAKAKKINPTDNVLKKTRKKHFFMNLISLE